MKWTGKELYYIDCVADLIEEQKWPDVAERLIDMYYGDKEDDLDLYKLLTGIGYIIGPHKFIIEKTSFNNGGWIVELCYPDELDLGRNRVGVALESFIDKDLSESECRKVLNQCAKGLNNEAILLEIISKSKFRIKK